MNWLIARGKNEDGKVIGIGIHFSIYSLYNYIKIIWINHQLHTNPINNWNNISDWVDNKIPKITQKFGIYWNPN